MHSARVQQRRQPQRGERPGAGGRSQLGGSRTEPRRSGPRRVASPTPVRNTSATPSATTRRQHTHVRHCRERRGGRLTSSSPRASSAAFSRTAMSTSSSRKNDARQALPSTAFTEVCISTSCARARTSGKARPCSAARSPPHAAKRWAATREAVHCSSCSSATTAGGRRIQLA